MVLRLIRPPSAFVAHDPLCANPPSLLFFSSNVVDDRTPFKQLSYVLHNNQLSATDVLFSALFD